MKVRKSAIVCLFLLLCSTGLAGNLVGKIAPQITVREWITSESLNEVNLAGSVYVLEFWTTWCHSCIENIPHLIALNNKYSDRGLVFISLSEDKSADLVRDFVQKKGINYHVAIDNGTADWFGITGYPTVFVVNHQGVVVFEGYPWSLEFEKAVAEAIKQAPPPLLAGIDLGPFDYLKEPLCGGKNFAKAYKTIELKGKNDKISENATVAKQIVQTIDRRITEKTRKADRLRVTDPAGACEIYADIVAKYDGIKAAHPAKAAYLDLKDRCGLKAQRIVAKRTEEPVE